MAPVIKELKSCPNFEVIIIVTAQHRELLDQVLNLFKIIPDYDLDIMESRQSLSQITSKVLQGLDEILISENPDIILVHGDTTTTFASALAGFYRQIDIGHVEAGLRTYDKYSPFPEEMNRHASDLLSDFYFAPTEEAKNNLLKEGCSEEKIFVTGNTVIDALLQTFDSQYEFAEGILSNLDYNKKRLILLTAHRRENLGEPLIDICQGVKGILEEITDVEVVFPVHPNPEVQKIVKNLLGEESRVHLITPLSYGDFVNLMGRVDLILTDSGGIQEEAPSLGKPVLVLRETTERPEAVKVGTAQLVGSSFEKIVNKSIKLLTDRKLYSQIAKKENPYGNGKAAEHIKEILINWS
jgi:UDP-N-acetylglucosamine 2-epimerase (non-hydrolysing)